MKSFSKKFLYLLPVIFSVLVLLAANLGEAFKYDIFSYKNTINHSSTLEDIWNKSRNHSEYIDLSSKYIENFIQNSIAGTIGDVHLEEWDTYTPNFSYPSSLEIISRYGRTINKYQYGKDFFEDFRGNIQSGIVKSKSIYLKTIDSTPYALREVVLLDQYNSKSQGNIDSIDQYLKYNGAAVVISPCHSDDLKYDAGFYDPLKASKNPPLIKFVVKKQVFDELIEYNRRGYTFKINSGASIKKTKYKNIYCVINGSDSKYKPLVIAVFYDGILKSPSASIDTASNFTIPSSILLDCIRSVDDQISNKPDRTIIFAFLSNFIQNRSGLNKLFDKNYNGDIILLDGIGNGDDLTLTYNKDKKDLGILIEKFLSENDFKILSKNITDDRNDSLVTISIPKPVEVSLDNFQTVYKSGKFILNLVGDECYNLDILTGNNRHIRNIKRYIKSHSIIISISTLLLLILIIFKHPPYHRN